MKLFHVWFARAAAFLLAIAVEAAPFTYQGRLMDGGSLANGIYDLRFALYDAATNGSQRGAIIELPATVVSSGNFTVSLEFGPGIFTGEARWLEIGARPGASGGAFVGLWPRQAVMATPYAAHAGSASNLLGSVTESQLPATIPRLYGSPSFTGTPTFNPLFGPPFIVGSTNTNRVAWLNADLIDGLDSGAFARSNHTHTGLEITAGTLPDARLSGNVPLLSTDQSFAGSNRFIGVVNATNPANFFAGNGGGLTNLSASSIGGVLPASTLPSSVARLTADQTFSGTVTFAPGTGAPFSVGSATLVTNLNADQLDGLSAASFWSVAGNSNASGAAFLGTIDNSPLDLRANNLRAMRLQPNALGASLVVGNTGNSVATNAASAAVVGGLNNSASNNYSVVLGGANNRAVGAAAIVLAGSNNSATNNSAVALGGAGNTAGGQYSLAAGRNARATHDGTFVWSDNSSANAFTSSAPNQLLLRASGGVGIGTNAPQNALHVAGTIEASGWKLSASPSAGALLTSDSAGNAAWVEAPVRIQTNGTSPNVIAGYSSNSVAPGVVGAVIGGGGFAGHTNFVGGNYGAVGGGFDNRVLNPGGAIAGGSDNAVTNDYGAIAGGVSNVAGDRAGVGGGQQNTAAGARSSVGGGLLNRAMGQEASVAGGVSNAASGLRAFVGGGATNVASGSRSVVAGGEANVSANSFSSVGGGFANTNTGLGGAIAGGQNNAASGLNSAIPGGGGNVANGSYSFAAGRLARALHNGSFVWSDNSSSAPFASSADNQFLIRATGGVGIGGAPLDALLDVEGDLRINDSDLLLRGNADRNHGLGWFGGGKLFSSSLIDGPVLYGWAGGALGLNQNGVQSIALTWNASRQVGIGVTSPAGGLHVRYDSAATDTPQAVLEQTAPGNFARMRLLNSSQPRWDVAAGGASNEFAIYNGASGTLLRLFTNGFLGLATAPANPLTIFGNGTSFGGVAGLNEVVGSFNGLFDSALSINSAFGLDSIIYLARGQNAIWDIRNAAANGNQFQLRNQASGGATYLAVTPAGSVGIGTTSPTDRLTVANGIRVDANDQNSGTKANSVRFGGDSTGEAIGSQRSGLTSNGAYGLDFYTGNSVHMHIANDGEVGIGTRSPGATLDVQGSVRIGVGGTVMNRLQSGTAAVGAGSGKKTITVTFPTAYGSTPKVMVTVKGDDFDDTFAVTTRAVNVSSFKVNIYRVDSLGGGWAQNLQVDWMAWE